MADAESNLVPSEAADQVEVALEEQAAADDGILYLNEYQYENDLVTDFARLVASPRRRGSLYVAAAIAALLGVGMLVAGGNWIKVGIVLIVRRLFGLVEQKPAPHARPRLYRCRRGRRVHGRPLSPRRRQRDRPDGLGQERQIAVLPV